jgi:hypothetical protein
MPRHARTLSHSLCSAYTELAGVLGTLGDKPPYRPVDRALVERLSAAHDALRDAVLACKRTPTPPETSPAGVGPR